VQLFTRRERRHGYLHAARGVEKRPIGWSLRKESGVVPAGERIRCVDRLSLSGEEFRHQLLGELAGGKNDQSVMLRRPEASNTPPAKEQSVTHW
jgi:hypothetical protein